MVEGDTYSQPVTIEEVEAHHPGRDGVPMGGLSARWKALKAAMQPGDELRYYTSSADSWKHLAGRHGIALLRGGKVVDNIDILIN
jgi:hypothetical protein